MLPESRFPFLAFSTNPEDFRSRTGKVSRTNGTRLSYDFVMFKFVMALVLAGSQSIILRIMESGAGKYKIPGKQHQPG